MAVLPSQLPPLDGHTGVCAADQCDRTSLLKAWGNVEQWANTAPCIGHKAAACASDTCCMHRVCETVAVCELLGCQFIERQWLLGCRHAQCSPILVEVVWFTIHLSRHRVGSCKAFLFVDGSCTSWTMLCLMKLSCQCETGPYTRRAQLTASTLCCVVDCAG